MRARALLLIVAAILAACSDGDDGSTSTTDPVATTDVAALDGFAACDDPPGDGRHGFDLERVSISTQGPVLTVAHRLAASAPSSTPALFTVTLASRYQLGVRTNGSQATDIFVFDLSDSRQENLTSTRAYDGRLMNSVYPLSELEGLTAPMEWKAVISVAGDDADSCEGTFPG